MKVILVMALTLDGVSGRNSKDPVDWTGKADKKKFVEITKEAGVIIYGSTTYDAIGRPLPKRKNIVLTRNKARVSEFDNLEYTAKEPETIIEDLEKEGFTSAALIGGSTINALFAKKNLIDEIYITIVPKLFGKGLSLFNCDLDLDLKLLEMETIDDGYILLKYSVVK
jgi:dihydrofolate reductase